MNQKHQRQYLINNIKISEKVMSMPVSLLKTQSKEQDSFYFNLTQKESNKKSSGQDANQLQMGISKSTRGRMQEKQWTIKEQKLLYQLHEQLGNRWSEISNHFQDKTDNDIKNHLFSRLRLSIRHLNKMNSTSQTKKTKEIKNSLLYKLISICQERFKPESKINKALIAFSYVLKKQLINFLYQHQEEEENTSESIAKDFELFSLISKNTNVIGKQQLQLLSERMEREDRTPQLEPILSHREKYSLIKQEQPSSPIPAEQPTKQQVLQSQHTHQLFFQLVSSGHHHDAIPSFIRSTTPDENDLINQLQKFQLSFLPPLSSVPEEIEGEFNELNLYYDFFNESQSPSI